MQDTKFFFDAAATANKTQFGNDNNIEHTIVTSTTRGTQWQCQN
jgi:hypothetical protein